MGGLLKELHRRRMRTKMATTKTKEKSGQLKFPAFQETTCWQPGMTGCDLHCGVLTLWSVDAASKLFSFGQIRLSPPSGGNLSPPSGGKLSPPSGWNLSPPSGGK